MSHRLQFFVAFFCVHVCVFGNEQSAFEEKFSNHINAFPTEPPFTGLPVPKPQTWVTSSVVFAVRNDGFQFNATGYTCDDLEAAFDRYYKIIFGVPGSAASQRNAAKRKMHFPADSDEINSLDVRVHNPCDGKPMPMLGMNELYKLQVSPGQAVLSADTLWGALRGLETFSQLVYETQYESHGIWMINQTTIEDYPRFPHRGVMIDTSRHFLEKNTILRIVSAMAMSKFNVLHWHIVDDPSFPYRSRSFPNLSHKGAYEPYTHTYDHDDIQEVIEFSRQRGIRVVAEFDTPGHTQSWGPGQAGLLTPCYGSDGKPDGTYGPVDPSKNSTYDFLATLFKEVVSVFPDRYIHLGGDEVNFNCWKSNPDVNNFMTKLGIKGDYAALESYYISRVTKLVSDLKMNYVVWQEPFDNGVKLAADTVVHVWKGEPYLEMAKVTAGGFKALLSSCWYLNRIAYGENWEGYYTCDPQNFTGTDAQKKLVMGGEACMWGEYVDGTNVMTRLWPRASVVAERLWSSKDTRDLDSMKKRLEEHRCRMVKRGLDADPIVPSYCRYEKQALPPAY